MSEVAMARTLESGEVISDAEEARLLAMLEGSLARHQVPTRVAGEGKRVWYVVHTKARQEMRAALELRNQSFGVFYPRVRVKVAHARRLIMVQNAFFPRYLFVEMGAGESVAPVNSTYGVSTIVHVPNRPPQVVPRGVIDELMGMADADGLIGGEVAKEQKVLDLAIGDSVLITRGPFADFVARLSRIDGKHVRAFVSIFGRETEMTLDPVDVKRVEDDGYDVVSGKRIGVASRPTGKARRA